MSKKTFPYSGLHLCMFVTIPSQSHALIIIWTVCLCDYCSPGVHTLGVGHKVRSHLKSKTDRIASANCVLHLLLIVLEEKHSITHRCSIKTLILEKHCHDLSPLLCSRHSSQKQLPALAYTYKCLPDYQTDKKKNN